MDGNSMKNRHNLKRLQALSLIAAAILSITYSHAEPAEAAENDPAQQAATSSLEAASVILQSDPHNQAALQSKATALLQLGRAKEASIIFKLLTEADPSSANWYQLGRSYLAMKELPAARQALQQAVNTDEQNIDAWRALGHLSHTLLADEKTAEAAYLKILELDKNDHDTRNRFVALLITQQRWQQATIINQFEQREQRTDAAAWIHEGRIKMQLKQPAAARIAFLSAVAYAPNNASAWHQLALTQSNVSEAEYAFKQALKLEPTAQRWHDYGVMLRLQKKAPQQAEKALQQALTLDKQHTASWLELGHAHATLKKTTLAEQQYRQAQLLDPELAAPHRALGNLYVDQKKNRKAEKQYKQCLKKNAEDAECRFRIAVLYHLSIKHPRKAERHYLKATKQADYALAAWQGLRLLYEGTRNNRGIRRADKAISALKAAEQAKEQAKDNQPASKPSSSCEPCAGDKQ